MSDHERIERLRKLIEQFPDGLKDIRFLLEYHDRRVTELIAANNRLVSERNIETGRREHFQSAVEFLLSHNGMKQLREAESVRRHLIHERDLARDDAQKAWAEAETLMVAAAKNPSLAAKALVWCRAIRALERARRGNGNVLEANRAYTEAHLALKAEASVQLERDT